jgi:ribosome-associated protein YbcJ (S4-like RNA binding protein)
MTTYTLYDDFITLGKLLKEAAIIDTGGAAKHFLATHEVLYNGAYENRRGKKLFAGDQLDFPEFNLSIQIVAATAEELAAHQAELDEAARVKALVKKLNATTKQTKSQQKAAVNKQQHYFKRQNSKPKFPGAH